LEYDVIISRGGTAELIQSAVELPVIDISISVYDILLSIKLAESYNGKFVIAGFPGITANAHLLCDLLQYDVDIITFKDSADAVNRLKKAKENGCTLVLCDVTGARAAKDIGLNYNLVTSGRESIENAVAEAYGIYIYRQTVLGDLRISGQKRILRDRDSTIAPARSEGNGRADPFSFKLFRTSSAFGYASDRAIGNDTLHRTSITVFQVVAD